MKSDGRAGGEHVSIGRSSEPQMWFSSDGIAGHIQMVEIEANHYPE